MSGSADVIELGSSDEEPEPASKKPKCLNAMVSIPDFTPGLKVQASKGKIPTQGLRVSKVQVAPSVGSLLKNPFANKQLVTAKRLINGKPGLPQLHYPQMRIPPTNQPIRVQSNVKTKNSMKSNAVKKIALPVNLNKGAARNFINPTSSVTAADMASAKYILKNLQLNKPQPVRTSIPIGQMGTKIIGMRCQNYTTPRQNKTLGKVTGKSVSVMSSAGLSGIAKNACIKSPASAKSIASPSTSGPPQLPPGITVTRVSGPTKKRRSKRPPSPAKVTYKKQKLNSIDAAEVPTVELDDDDEDTLQNATTASPQWYVRPEQIDDIQTPETKKLKEPAEPEPRLVEQKKQPESVTIEKPEELEKVSSMQVENDKEPDAGGRTMIEITIDDSPIKPPPIPQAKMVSDLAIIVEDSPKKPGEKKKKSKHSKKNVESSSNENNELTKSPHSRKKLNFPKQMPDFIEVEVDFLNPINIPPGSNIPISDIINLDTPTKPIQDSFEPKTIKSKPSTPLKKNASGGGSSKINEELNSALKLIGTKEVFDTNKNVETNKPEKVDISNIKDKKATNIKKVDSSKKSEHKSLGFTNEVISNEFEATRDKVNVLESNAVNVLESNVVESEAKEGKTKNVNPIDSKQSKQINSKLEDSSQINQLNTPGLNSKDKKIYVPGEFHQIYQEFIDLCFKIENSDDMTKIVEKKVKEYYRQVDPSFTESKDFIDIVSAKIAAIKLNPEHLYLYIKDIVDELKMRRKQFKGKVEVKEKAAEPCADQEVSHSEGAEASDGADGSSRNIRRLEKTMRKLHRAIHKLEEEEVDFDDDTESVYLLTESKDGNSSRAKDKPVATDRQIQIQRYKARFIRVHAKLLQLTGTRMPSEARVKLEARPGRPAGPTLRLEKWINKRVPVGAPLPFPDFHDVVRCVKEANSEDRLGWSEMEVMEEARDLFSRCGKKLQKRRQANEWRLASSRISAEMDPADVSPDLKHKLDDNKKLAAKRETDIINKYADRQNQLQLEAVEINDNEVDESAPSSDDDVQAIENEEKLNESNKILSPHKVKVQAKSPEKVTKYPDSKKIQEIFLDKTTTSEDKEPEIVTVQDIDSTNDTRKTTELEEVKLNGSCRVFSDMGIVTELNDEHRDTQNDKEAANAFESEGEDIRLVLSDEDSNAEVNNIDCDGQSLLQKRSGVENVISTVESSDTDAPIAISESYESSDSQHGSIKSSDIVSIENSSSGLDIHEGDVNPSTPSKEKLSLLEIDDSEEESDTQGKLLDNNTENDTVSHDNVLGSTEKELNACRVSNEIQLAFIPNNEAEEELNLCDPPNEGIIYETAGEPEQRDITEYNKSDKNNSPRINTTCDQSNKQASKQKEILEECDLGTENSNSQSVDDNENNSSSENQNSDIPMDIGPTEIQGTLCVDNEINSSSSDVPMDTGPTMFQRALSIDDNVSESSENQSCDVPLDIGPTIIQGTLLVNDDENSCDNNENINSSLQSCQVDQEPTISDSETAPETFENISCDIPMDIGPTIIQRRQSVNDDENNGDNDENIDRLLQSSRDESETTSSDSGTAPDTVETTSCDVPIDIGPTIIQGRHSVNDEENSCDNNQNNDRPIQSCSDENEPTMSDSETTLDPVETKRFDVSIDIGPTLIQGTLSVNYDENSCENNQCIDRPLQSCQDGNNPTISESETEQDILEATNCDFAMDIGPTIIQGRQSVNDDENNGDNDQNIGRPLQSCSDEREPTMSDSETALDNVETTRFDVPMDFGPTIIQGALTVNDDENSCDNNENIDRTLQSCRAEREPTMSDSETETAQELKTTSTKSHSVEILPESDLNVESVTYNMSSNVKILSRSPTITDTETVDNSCVTSAETVTHPKMNIMASENDSIQVPNVRETSASVSLIPPPQLNVAIAGD